MEDTETSINRESKSGDTERICHNGKLVEIKALISETFNQHFVSIGERLVGEISAPVNDIVRQLSSEMKCHVQQFGQKSSDSIKSLSDL